YMELRKTRGLSDNLKLNLILQKLAAPADIVLDLHTGPCATRYLYSSELLAESSKQFKMPFTLIYPNIFSGAMDEASQAPWWRLTSALEEVGKRLPPVFESYTIELGSQERLSLEEAEQDAARILHYLNYKGLAFKSSPTVPSADGLACYLKDYKSYYAPRGGLYQFMVAPGQKFAKNQVLARSLNLDNLERNGKLDDCLFEVTAAEEGIVINHSVSAILSEGSELVEVMENSFAHS
ncbi:MAG: succinylglutamate desuccinylase, partial [Halobacteriovoraceae bacterium]|nr:succinylglutamate desuccinylase [Halobacteriovoraceae bacterium]